MKLSKQCLGLTALASSDTTRGFLSKVHVAPTAITVTNGGSLGRVTIPAETAPEEEPLRPCVVAATALAEIAKRIPRGGEGLVVDTARSNASRALCGEIPGAASAEFSLAAESNYPPVEKVFPQGEPRLALRFDANLLERVLKVAQGILGNQEPIPAVLLEFFRPGDSGESWMLRITAENTTTGYTGMFLVLPCVA